MARIKTEETGWAYYPPRARWYRRICYPWFELRRALDLEAVRLPTRVSVLRFVLSLVIPGYAFFAHGRRDLGPVFLAAYGLGAILFVVALGYSLGGLGYAVMISAHASSIIFLEGYWLREYCGFGFRLVLAGLTLLIVWVAVYAPLIGYAERQWIVPLGVRRNVVIVQRLTLPHNIKRGDQVVYSLRADERGDAHGAGGAIWIQAGFGWGPVLAVAGDRVEFSTDAFRVNGVGRPLLAHMPRSGEVVVPERHWFIWPELDINGHGNVSEATVATVMMQLAAVSENQFIGRPFRYWFGRRQVTP